MKLSPGNDFTNVLRAAFTCLDPKDNADLNLFLRFWDLCVKAACRHVGEIDIWGQFHQHFMCSFWAHSCVHRSQESKKILMS